MVEKSNRHILDIYDAEKMQISDPRVAVFEARLAAVKPIDVNGRRVIEFNSETGSIAPDRIIPAVLWLNEGGTDADILIGNERMQTYHMYIHQQIAENNRVRWSIIDTCKTTLMTVGEKRFLSLGMLPHLWGSNLDKTKSVLERYKINGVFAPTNTFFEEGLAGGIGIRSEDNNDGVTWLSQKDFTTTMDELVKDDWTSRVAQVYGLTNTELLRMRITGELPDEKREPIKSKVTS